MSVPGVHLGADLEVGVPGIGEVDTAIDLGLLASKKDLIAMENRIIRNANSPFFERVVAAFSGISAAGAPPPALGFKVYDVPDGMKFILTKFICWGDAHNPSSGGVYNNAAAWGGLFHGVAAPAALADFWPEPEASTFQVLPYTREYGWDTGPEWRQNDNVYFQMVAPPATENITVLLFGFLASLKSKKVLESG
jgi:hypothetical protein